MNNVIIKKKKFSKFVYYDVSGCFLVYTIQNKHCRTVFGKMKLRKLQQQKTKRTPLSVASPRDMNIARGNVLFRHTCNCHEEIIANSFMNIYGIYYACIHITLTRERHKYLFPLNRFEFIISSLSSSGCTAE